MNRRSLIVSGLSLVSLALLCCAFVQHRTLLELRNQRQLAPPPETVDSPNANRSSENDSVTPETNQAIAQAPVSSELLKLRNQASQLRRLRDQLAPIATEQQQLKEKLATRSTNSTASGYIRKSQAKFAGYDTPENTLQTFLWAVRNKDYQTFVHTLTPEFAQGIHRAEQANDFAVEKMFEDFDALVGFGIVSKEKLDPTQFQPPPGSPADEEVISAQVQIAADIPPEPIVFRRIGGEWKMNWPELPGGR